MSTVNTPQHCIITDAFSVASTTLLVTGSADNTMKLWRVQDGICLFTWNFPTAVKRVEFSEDGNKLLCVTEQRMGHIGTVNVYDIAEDGAEQSNNPMIAIPTQESKATVAGWSFLDKYIIMGHENGTVSQWDWKVLMPLCVKGER